MTYSNYKNVNDRKKYEKEWRKNNPDKIKKYMEIRKDWIKKNRREYNTYMRNLMRQRRIDSGFKQRLKEKWDIVMVDYFCKNMSVKQLAKKYDVSNTSIYRQIRMVNKCKKKK